MDACLEFHYWYKQETRTVRLAFLNILTPVKYAPYTLFFPLFEAPPYNFRAFSTASSFPVVFRIPAL